MEKVYGSPKRQDGLYKIGRNKWELIYGFGKDNETDETGWNWRQRFVGRKPTAEEIRQVIMDQIDAETKRKILTDFRWNGVHVWLSQENQMNFKAAYDLAVQTNGVTLPVMFKLGEDGQGNALNQTFVTMDYFTDFYTKMVSHIHKALDEGWAEKDAVDMAAFAVSQ